ncbi:glycosyltransferase family 4 protein [Candidatus Pelagibacter sp.]|uniref:glycosyltransferase family 4 protein n=1 Tax=Candidatus Pelagibacter sp. TaxID=2024849 RepID=UPI003F824B64
MKIFFDHEIFYQQKYGGITSYFSNLGKQLTLKGVDIKFICPIHKSFNLNKIPKNKITGIRLSYPGFLNSMISNINNHLSKRIYDKLNPSIIHRTYFSEKKFSNKFKNIITFYDIAHELKKTKEIKNEKFKLIKENNVKNADHILCISKTVKKDLIEYFNVNENKISVSYLSSDYEKISDTELKKKKKLQNYLLYVGNRSGYKNFKNFISAFAHSNKLKKDFKLLIFGGENKKICGNDVISENKLSHESVKFVSGTNEYLKYLYKNVRAFIYPSCYEGFGIPIIEAMRSGCPLVSSNGGALREVAGDGINFFNPNDCEDITDKIEKLVYSEENISKSVKYGLDRCDYFSWSKCADKTIEAYKKISQI